MKSPQNSLPTYGLLLCGGFSSRMGREKAFLPHQGQYLYQHIYTQLTLCLEKVWLSCRRDQQMQFPSDFSTIIDQEKWAGNGPLSGILSAMALFPEAHWLVIPTDFPLITAEDLRKLLPDSTQNFPLARFYRSSSPFPVWLNASMAPFLQKECLEGKASLHACLKNLSVQALDADNPQNFLSANSPDDYPFSV